MKQFGLVFIAIFTLVITSFTTNEEKKAPVEGKSLVKWMTFEEAMKKGKKEPRKIFIDVYTDWCGWCKVMDKKTFSNPKIAKYINENYYAVKFNGEQKESITLNGKEYKYVPSGRRGYHELAAAIMKGKLSYPTVVFLDEKFSLIQPIPGYQKPEQLDPILKFIGEDLHKKKSWQEYQKEYVSPF